MRNYLSLMLIVNFAFTLLSHADTDGSLPEKKIAPQLPPTDESSLFEMSPWIKTVSISKTGDVMRIILKASAPTECYKHREVERILEKNLLKIIPRLRRPQGVHQCTHSKNFDYEEKVYESPIDLAPTEVWVLGYEGWHKMKVN